MIKYTINLSKRMESDSSVGTATGYWLDGRRIEVLFPTEERDFSLLSCVQAGSQVHLAYLICTEDIYPESKAAEA
jgi:hypothetical protein